MSFTLGADPECFLIDAAGSFISAIDLVGGTKEHPIPLPIGEGFAVQEDNVALEYNVPPAASKDQFVNNINKVMSYLSDQMGQKGLYLSRASATLFPEEQLVDHRARTFGCDPDFNAWREGKANRRPKATDATLRTCGGHIHVGYKFTSQEEVIKFIKYCDLFLGVPSVLLDDGALRKELYGKAGAFRFKSYGCEYRTLSNFWVVDPAYTAWAWSATEMAMDAWQQNKINVELEGPAIVHAINKNNRNVAQELIDRYNLPMA